MNFKQLEAFIWVAELQSFTKASRQLFMSQPAVSFQIKALEEDLQVTLFQRGDKKVILTEAGRLLYPEAKQMIRHYNRIKAGLDDLKGLKTGHLVVGASTIPGEYLLPVLIGGFKEKYPGIKITLKVAGSGQVGRWVREREIDFGITGLLSTGKVPSGVHGLRTSLY
jgi:DNA-binding transcriptional LysR family regulator